MKNKILFLIFALIFIVLSGIAYAGVPVNYALREATILSSGSISYSNNPVTDVVTDVNAIGFVCADANCNDIDGSLWNGQVQSSGTASVLQLTFPTNLPASGYYAVFFYKQGYIPYEVKAWWHGRTTVVQSSTAYLAKKDMGRAPIDGFSVLNDVQPNVPLVIEIGASLDATTYSALYNAGPVGYIPLQLSDHYSVETEVRLRIYDDSNNIVYEQVQTVNIPYSGSERVEFSWTPTEDGDYRAVATSLVTDDKFLASEEHEVVKEFTVLEEEPKEMCYTLLNNVKISDQFPNTNEIITISGSKISNYADNDYILTAIPTELVLQIFDGSGVVVYQDSLTVGANDNVVDKEVFSFEWTPSQEGWYDILVTASADSNLCIGLSNNDETEIVKVYVYGAASASAPVLEGIPDQVLNEGETISSVDLWDYADDEDTADEDLSFSIVSQSNEDLTVCSINSDGHTLDCTAQNGYGVSQVTVEVSDGEYTDRDSFTIVVRRDNAAPVIGNVPNVELMIGEVVVLDLDDYVVDDEPTGWHSWDVEGDEHVRVEIDSHSHIAAITTKDDEWHGQENLVFTVTDSAGLNDSDVCAVTVLDEHAPEPEKNTLSISNIAMNDVVGSDEILQLNVRLYNRGNQDLEDIRISALILDLDSYDSAGPFDLDEDDSATKHLFLTIPEDVEPGYYYIRVSVNGKEVRRVVYREVVIV